MKYRLIREYPGSPKLGTILTHEELQYCIWNEYYQEVVEKDYEILLISLHRSDKPKITNMIGCGNDYILSLLNCDGNKIHSIKRLSDSEIFTIGDKTYDGKITKFELNNNNSINVFIENVTWIKLDLLIKSKTPLFKTEDGVDIFEGDKLYSICNMLNIKKHRLFNARYDDNTLLNNRIFFNSDYKHFSTKEKAEEYIIENKPVLSLNDILNLKKKGFARNSTIFHEVKELVKQKIKQ